MLEQLEQEVELIHRHLILLTLVVENEPIGIVRLSNKTGFPHHKVRYSLRTLEDSNYIEPTQQGAVSTSVGREFLETAGDEFDGFVQRLEEMSANEVPVKH